MAPFELLAALVFVMMIAFIGVRIWAGVMLAKERRRREERDRQRELARDRAELEESLRAASEAAERAEDEPREQP